MKTSLRTWFSRVWFLPAGRWKHRAKVLSACATIGLATAWAPSAEAVTVNLSVTPAETIDEAAVVYYVLNASSGYLGWDAYPLGTLLAGQTGNFVHEFPEIDLDGLLYDIAHWPPLGEDYGFLRPGYAIVGLHGTGENQGVVFSFPATLNLPEDATFESFFAPMIPPNLAGYLDTEQRMLDYLQESTWPDPKPSWAVRAGYLEDNLRNVIEIPFNQPAQLVGFSDATSFGTAIATVPEPASWVLLVSSAGVFLIAFRRRQSSYRTDQLA